MDFYRVGDKLVSREKLMRTVDRILGLRAQGMSQQEVAHRIGCDRTFISRLEALAEVRKGGALAVIGFPLANAVELTTCAEEMGVDYVFLMTDKERWQYVESLNGVELLNDVMGIMTRLRDYDTVIMIGSDMRIRLAEAILGEKVVGVPLGPSPIEEDVYFARDRLEELISTVKGGH